eukprot:gnl/Dysnectes_brevis/8985_a16388_164.p1 GENE.gnl/Dysnectes_brevis/8985_a16388_164~~gnl/Dysnectes_brevis/8985_a16388_164.p1  ORF type:complete len:636 (+),score=240.21 gnl/Dysnectes_brevis/8985_a16388_164:1-1908(+)
MVSAQLSKFSLMEIEEASPSDRTVVLDLVSIAKQLVSAETKLSVAPQLLDLQDALSDARSQVTSLKGVRKQLEHVRELYRAQLAQGGTSRHGGGGGGGGEGGEGNDDDATPVVINSKTGEPNAIAVPLIGDIPLSKIAPRLQTPPPSLEWTQAVILSFLRAMAQLAFISGVSPESYVRQFSVRPLPLYQVEPNPSRLPPFTVPALFSGWITTQYPERIAAEHGTGRLLQGIKQHHRDMVVVLGNNLLGGEVTSDEFSFMLYVSQLTHGGLPPAPGISVSQLSRKPEVRVDPVPITRVHALIEVCLARVQQGQKFMATFLEQGRAAGLVWPEDGTMVVHPHFLLMSLVKAFRTEVQTRLEAARVMFAGTLAESATRKMNSLSWFRVTREILKTINPIADDTLLTAVYCDTLRRSKALNWNVLIDAARSRGLFVSALRFPPVQTAIALVGGYHTTLKKPPKSDINRRQLRVRQLADAARKALAHLSAVLGPESFVMRAVLAELQACEQHLVNESTLGIAYTCLRSSLDMAIASLLSTLLVRGMDVSVPACNEAVSVFQERAKIPISAPRNVEDIMVNELPFMLGRLCSLLGWQVSSSGLLSDLSSMKRKGSGTSSKRMGRKMSSKMKMKMKKDGQKK